MYFSSDKNAAKDVITGYINKTIKERIPMEVTVSSNVEPTNLLIAETFDISVTCSYVYPLSSIFSFFGLPDTVNDVYKKGLAVSDSKETLRSIKYAKDLYERKTDGASIQEVLDQINKKFKEK